MHIGTQGPASRQKYFFQPFLFSYREREGLAATPSSLVTLSWATTGPASVWHDVYKLTLGRLPLETNTRAGHANLVGGETKDQRVNNACGDTGCCFKQGRLLAKARDFAREAGKEMVLLRQTCDYLELIIAGVIYG